MKTSLLLLALLFPLPCFAAFADVTATRADADGIAYVQAQGIVQGYTDGTFRPDAGINRAEFTKIIVGALFAPEGNNCFSDVKEEWFAPSVCAAKTQGIIGGYPDGTFKPSQNIAFAEAAKIIASAFGGVPQGEFAVWYEPYVRALAIANAIPTEIDSFETHLTRGQMAEMIYRLHAKVINKSSKSYETLAGLPETASGEQKSSVRSTANGNSKGFAITENYAEDWNFYIDTTAPRDPDPKKGYNLLSKLDLSHVEQQTDDETFRDYLRVHFPKGSASPFVSYFYEKPWGGVVARALGDIRPSDTVKLTYYVRFPKNFDFSASGGLPAIGGGITSSNYGVWGSDFAAGIGWDKHGNIEPTGNFYSKIDPSRTTNGKFNADNTWHKIEITAQLNTVPVKRLNGVLKISVDDTEIYKKEDVHFRGRAEDLFDSLGFYAVIGTMDTFSVAPYDMYLDLAGFEVSVN